MATDDFNRSDGGLGGNWTVEDGTWAVASNQASCSDANQNTARWSGTAIGDNHYAQVKIVSGGSQAGPATRITGATCYQLFVYSEPTGSWELYTFDGVNYGLIGSGSGGASGETWRLESNGNTHKVFKNGVQQGTDISDSTYTTGDPGMQGFNVNTLDDWEGGDLGGGGGGDAVPVCWAQYRGRRQ